MKIGQFSLAFNDLQIPLPGIEVSAVRMYKSNALEMGDFGYGWNLDLTSTKLQETCIPGDRWNLVQTDSLACILGYCISLPKFDFNELRKHQIAIKIPGGRTQVFDIVPHTFGTANLYYGYFTFEPQTGTYSTLTPLDVGNFVIMGGKIYDEGGDYQEPYNPQQYKLTLRDSTYYIFDQNAGGLVEVGDRNGNTITIGKNEISHSAGSAIQIIRDMQDRVTSISDGTGRSVIYMISMEILLKS